MKSCINRFGQLAGLVKKVKRTGWTRYLPKEKVESVGDHSAKIAFLALYLRGIENIDYLKCMEMALIHDIAEGIVGDFTPHCKITYAMADADPNKSLKRNTGPSSSSSKNWKRTIRCTTRVSGCSTSRERPMSHKS